jgi:hypothetical protein
MRATLAFATFALSVSSLGLCLPAQAAATAQSRACWAKADDQHLHGMERVKFHAACLKGAGAAPEETGRTQSSSRWAKAVTAPSGVTPATRSRECSREADRRGLTSNKRESFRLACIGSVAPVRAVGAGQEKPAPTHAKGDPIVNAPNTTGH